MAGLLGGNTVEEMAVPLAAMMADEWAGMWVDETVAELAEMLAGEWAERWVALKAGQKVGI